MRILKKSRHTKSRQIYIYLLKEEYRRRKSIMDKNFACGIVLGLLGGMLIVANSYKARKLVKDSQEEIKNKVAEMTEKKDRKKDEDLNELGD